MQIDPRFKKGLELFNEKEFYECHEVIEQLWLETKKDDSNRDLYKGVIQAAAALYQFKRGILSGAFGLFKTSLRNLERYQPVTLGLNVGKLIEGMQGCCPVFKEWDGKKEFLLDEKQVPVLEFRIDQEKA